MEKLRIFWKKHHAILLTVLGVFFVLGVWWTLSALTDTALIPSPWAAFSNLATMLTQFSVYQDLWGTLKRLLIGFGLSFVLGSLVGILAGIYKQLQYFLKPLMVTIRTLPTAAVMLIFLALFHFADAPYYIVFLVVFPIAYESMVTGINHIDQGISDSLRIEGERKYRSIFYVRVPLTAPYVLLGIFQSLGLGMKVEIMSEILAGDGRMDGLGIGIKLAYDAPNYLDMYGYALLAVLLIGLIEFALYMAKKYLVKK